MSRDTSGNYTLFTGPNNVNPVVPDTIIATSWANPTLNDIATAMSDSLSRSGNGGMTANLAMGGFQITGLGPATAPDSAPTAKQVRDVAFSWLSGVASDAGGNLITGNASLGAVAPVIGTMYVFMPDKVNTSNVSLNVSGLGAVPITINAAPIPAGTMFAGRVVTVVYNGTSYAMTSGGGGSGVNTLNTADAQMLTVTQPTITNYLLTPQSNVSNGMVKLTGGGKVPVNLLPADGLTMLGLWDAAPGNLPANGTIAGQYYIITNAGSLILYVPNGAGGWVQQFTAVVAGDMILWNQIAPEPVGWYKVAKAAIGPASAVANVATPSFVATNLQSWINAADSATGFLLANGTRLNTGTQKGGSWAAAGNGTVTGNIISDGAGGWKFIDSLGWGWLRISTAAGGFDDYVSGATGVAGGVAGLFQCSRTTPVAQSFFQQQLGVGGTPRNLGGVTPYNLDVQASGICRATFFNTASTNAIRLVSLNDRNALDAVRMLADGSISAGGGVLPFNIRMGNGVGGVFNALTCNGSGLVEIGDNTLAAPGAITSTQKVFGALNAALDFRLYQTAIVNVGSTVTGITMATGQVARIKVAGSGAITLPVVVKLPRGGAVYGTTATMIGLYNDGGIVYATFTPYD